ncbi:TIGR02281 family clan AA aspartic protease [Pseudomonadota bacterium]
MEQPEGKDELQSKTGRGFAWIAVIAVMFGLTAFYQALSQRDGGIISSSENGSHALVVLQRERSGHYVAEGQINGNVVMFLVDTGATDVAVSEKMARAMGLDFGPRIRVMTAAGPVNAWVTRLDQVSLGSLELSDVRATITPGLNDAALLGMSFLKHFSLRQDGDQLRIEQTGQNGEGSG